jgi:hypothetical protein
MCSRDLFPCIIRNKSILRAISFIFALFFVDHIHITMLARIKQLIFVIVLCLRRTSEAFFRFVGPVLSVGALTLVTGKCRTALHNNN